MNVSSCISASLSLLSGRSVYLGSPVYLSNPEDYMLAIVRLIDHHGMTLAEFELKPPSFHTLADFLQATQDNLDGELADTVRVVVDIALPD